MSQEPSGWDVRPLSDRELTQGCRALFEACIASGRSPLADPIIDSGWLNPDLPVETGPVTREGPWRHFTLLTPWTLYRVAAPLRHPGPPPPQSARSSAPASQSHPDGGRPGGPDQRPQLPELGPALAVILDGRNQKAHLQHDPTVGHFLLQPLVSGLAAYADAAAVHAAWEGVERHRLAMAERKEAFCPLRKQLSRRNLFFGRGSV